MSDHAKIALLILPLCLIGGGLIFITRGNGKRLFFFLWPIVLVGDILLGFLHGWPIRDYMQVGIILLLWVLTGFIAFRSTAKSKKFRRPNTGQEPHGP